MIENSLNTFGYLDKNNNKICPYKNLISNNGFSTWPWFFPEGLPGFEENKEFAFLFNENSNPFILMNFCGDSKLSLMCVDPFFVLPDYELNLSKDDKLALNVSSVNELVVLVIVKIDKENIAKGIFSEGSLILKSPLVFNPKNYYAKQISNGKPEYLEPYKFKDIKKLE